MATAKKIVFPSKTTRTAGKQPAAPATRTKKTAAPKLPVTKKVTLKPAATPQVQKAEKSKKHKLVRDSFTIPKIEYVVLEALKQRAVKLAHPVKKSELIRAGIKALAAMPDAAFMTALANVPAIKTGRPAA